MSHNQAGNDTVRRVSNRSSPDTYNRRLLLEALDDFAQK